MYGISVSPNRYSHGLIQKTKEFVINFAPYEIADIINFCGKNSGRNTDKIKKMNLTLEPAQKINTPIIKECFSHLECRLYNTIKLGDHTIFVGEVVNVMADKIAFRDGLLDTKKIKPTYYIGGNIFTTISKTRVEF